jgi:membrane protein
MLGAGPPVVGASLWATSQLAAASQGWLRSLSPSTAVIFTFGPALLTWALLAGLFRVVPSAPVRWREAVAGGLLGSIVLELGKRAFAAWVLKLPTYTTVYGAFALLPVFLLWVYFSWLVTLVAALVAVNVGKARAAPAARTRPRPGRAA